MPQYKVTIKFNGSAIIDLNADSPEKARLTVEEMELSELTRAGHADITSFDIAAREITAVISPDHINDEEEGNRKPRPSGWYRPA